MARTQIEFPRTTVGRPMVNLQFVRLPREAVTIREKSRKWSFRATGIRPFKREAGGLVVAMLERKPNDYCFALKIHPKS